MDKDFVGKAKSNNKPVFSVHLLEATKLNADIGGNMILETFDMLR